ncbi:MAG TPA: hypothetical protein VMG99_00360 [Thermoplasmata archaeon]|nr:hypothetical protein [Thermoplasmata archaeon]
MSRTRSAPRPGPDDDLRDALDRVGRDRVRGATALARAALRALRRGIRERGGRSGAPTAAWVLDVADRLSRAQPAMGTFGRWADDWRRIARLRSASARARALRAWSVREDRRQRAEPTRLARVAWRRMPRRARWLTLSHSATVERIFAGAPRDVRPREVVVLRSLPGGEGAELARALRTAGLRVRLVPDRAGPMEAARAEAVLLGADTVAADGTLTHKVGTRRVARAAWAAGVPVFVAAAGSKWARRRPVPRRLPPGFDRTPARWIAEFWTDRGVARSVAARAREGRQRHPPRGGR